MFGFRRPKAPEVVITRNTPTEVARALSNSWQEEHTMEFLNEVGRMTKDRMGKGLDRKRAVAILLALGNGIEGLKG